jgi:hypothetical protein
VQQKNKQLNDLEKKREQELKRLKEQHNMANSQHDDGTHADQLREIKSHVFVSNPRGSKRKTASIYKGQLSMKNKLGSGGHHYQAKMFGSSKQSINMSQVHGMMRNEDGDIINQSMIDQSMQNA